MTFPDGLDDKNEWNYTSTFRYAFTARKGPILTLRFAFEDKET